jgi:Flp pilus assembly protein TadD/ketosteroid isomerase-like protein
MPSATIMHSIRPSQLAALKTTNILINMKHAKNYIQSTLRWVTLAAAMSFTHAYADDYAEVSQLMRSGKYTEALNKADQYLSSKPRDPQMRFLKGVIQRDTGKTAEALTTFTRLTEDYPELPEPYNNLAVLYAGQSQFDKARVALEMAIRTNPSYSTAHENLGDVYAKLASQAYVKALQLDANNPAVAPKMALIRELFNPAAQAQRPFTASTTPAQTSRPVTGSISSALSQKPAPSLPKPPVASKTPNVPSSVAVSPVAPAASPAPAPAPATATPAPVAAATAATAPVIAASNAATAAKAEPKTTPVAADSKEVQKAVLDWANAWSSRNIKRYLAAYSKDFATPGSMSRSAWEKERRQRIVGKSKISVRLENLAIDVNGDKATAQFRQVYRANEFSATSRKTLELVNTGGRWLIVKESIGK